MRELVSGLIAAVLIVALWIGVGGVQNHKEPGMRGYSVAERARFEEMVADVRPWAHPINFYRMFFPGVTNGK